MSGSCGDVGMHVRWRKRLAVLAVVIGLAVQCAGCKEKAKVKSPTPVSNENSTVESPGQPTPSTSNVTIPKHYNSPDLVRFAKGVLFKPSMEVAADDVWMAPLIVSEVQDGSDGPIPAPFGTLIAGEANQARIDCAQPAVYSFTDMVELGGSLYPRAAHLWFYESSPSATIALSCVEVVSNEDAEPVLWHVFDSLRSDKDAVYVAKSVEQEAEREHGARLDGAALSVELPNNSSPVIVPRLLDDGPEPMGPMVYVAAEPHHVAAVACRCMGSQVEEILDARFYRQIKLTGADGDAGSISQQVQVFLESNGIPIDDRFRSYLSRDLGECLRLPSSL